MKNIISKLVILLATVVTFMSTAQAQLRIGDVGYGGTGCVAGSLKMQRGQVLLQNFKLDLQGGKSLDRLACDLAIPFEAEAGYQVGLVAPDIQGRARLSNSGVLQIHTESFISGQRSIQSSDVIRGRRNASVLIRSKNQTQWSECGASGILRMRVVAHLQDKLDSRSLASIDVLKARRGALLVVRACH